MTNGYYVYAIQRRGTKLPPKLTGLDDRPLVAVPHGDLEAVVSETDRPTLQASAENVLRHETVVEGVREMGPAIPVRFGTVLSHAEAVAGALSSRYAVLDEDLRRFGDKIEMGLSALWDPPPETAVNELRNVDGSDLQGIGTRYMRTRLLERRRDAQIRLRAEDLARSVNADLASHALDYTTKILPTPRLPLRVAYLMHPSSVGDFQDAFAELPRQRTDVRFLLSGPWPPYSFVTRPDADERSAIEGLLG